jgi:hypothetical protein
MKLVREDLKEDGGTKIGIVKLGKAAGKVTTKKIRDIHKAIRVQVHNLTSKVNFNIFNLLCYFVAENKTIFH